MPRKLLLGLLIVTLLTFALLGCVLKLARSVGGRETTSARTRGRSSLRTSVSRA